MEDQTASPPHLRGIADPRVPGLRFTSSLIDCPYSRPAICLFYLILRGLDTIEDDMSLDVSMKNRLLREFHQYLYQPGWNFEQSGPKEKDRHLLVGFQVVGFE